MNLVFGFIAENYGIMPYFPAYDSIRISLSYYPSSTYPLFVGCLKGFCVSAGTYKGWVRDSGFIVRDHERIIDSIRAEKKNIQEFAEINRFFFSGKVMMGFEVGLLREIYASSLLSKNEIFPNNELILGNVKQGILLGGVLGFKENYLILRFRRFNVDSVISSGDTTGWFITLPETESKSYEVLLKLKFLGNSIKVHRRDMLSFWIDREFRNFMFGIGYSQKVWLVYSSLGFKVRMIDLKFSLAHFGRVYFGFGTLLSL